MSQRSPGKNAFTTALLATIVLVFAALIELPFLARHTEVILARYGWWILAYVVAFMLNVYQGSLWVIHTLNLAGSGRALRQVDREMQTGDSVLSGEVNDLFAEVEAR